jgi:hypothetical protein
MYVSFDTLDGLPTPLCATAAPGSTELLPGTEPPPASLALNVCDVRSMSSRSFRNLQNLPRQDPCDPSSRMGRRLATRKVARWTTQQRSEVAPVMRKRPQKLLKLRLCDVKGLPCAVQPSASPNH